MQPGYREVVKPSQVLQTCPPFEAAELACCAACRYVGRGV